MKTLLIAIAVAAFATSALADIARPTPPKKEPRSVSGYMRINLRSTEETPVLKIRRDVVDRLIVGLDDANRNGDSSVASVDAGSVGRLQTFFGGLLLSIGLVAGGLIFFKRDKKGIRTAAIAVALIAVSGSTIVLANTPPPWIVNLSARIFEKNTRAYGFASGRVRIQIIDSKDDKTPGDVVLELPKIADDDDPDE